MKTCDICKEPALYDAVVKTGLWTGSWAFLCQKCFDNHKCKLGVGLGQKLKET